MKSLLAVAQMRSDGDKDKNINEISQLAQRASLAKARLLCLPENCVYMANKTVEAAESLNGASISRLRAIAVQNSIWLSIGGFQEQLAGSDKIYNTHLILDDAGKTVAFYRKIHLFNVLLPNGERYEEAKFVLPGQELVSFVGPSFIGGLSICFDVRFPKLFWDLREKGAEVLFVPAAFTQTTGKAHWEVLLRARAIETQSYVLAAAQVGENIPGRFTYGHAMIVDPWGRVLAECDENESMIFAEIDIALVKLRREMPLTP